MAVYLPLTYPELVDLTPIISAMNIPSLPTLSMYENLNAKEWVRNKMTKYIYYKLMDDWFHEAPLEKLLDILPSKFGKDKKSKIKYIEDKIFVLSDMKKVLLHLTTIAKINWYDLHKREELIKDLLIKHLEPMFKKMKN